MNAVREHLTQDILLAFAKLPDRSQFLQVEEFLSVNLKKDTQGGSPGLFDGAFPTGQPELSKASNPPKPALICQKEFSTPNGPIQSIPCAVPGHSEHWPFQSILSQAGNHVSVVVLHGNDFLAGCHGKSGRDVVGMRICHNHFGI